MTPLLLGLTFFSGICSVAGQIFLKLGMSDCRNNPTPRRLIDLAAGGLVMTIGFFTWLILLQRFNLSYLYPFEGLNSVFLVLGALYFLRENLTRELWIGVILTCLGMILVSTT